MRTLQDVENRLKVLGLITSPVVEVIFDNDELRVREEDRDDWVDVPLTNNEWSYFYENILEGEIFPNFK